MFEEKQAKAAEIKAYIDELINEYSREDLNEIARGLEIDPDDYSNKKAIAEAILEAREIEEALIVESSLEYLVAEEVRKEVETVTQNSVRGKIKAMAEQIKENERAAVAFNASVQELYTEYTETAALYKLVTLCLYL